MTPRFDEFMNLIRTRKGYIRSFSWCTVLHRHDGEEDTDRGYELERLFSPVQSYILPDRQSQRGI